MTIYRVLCAAALAAALAEPAHAIAFPPVVPFDAVTDFSSSQNPNGVWSYLDGTGNLLTGQMTVAGGSIPLWDNGPAGFPYGSFVGVNTTASDITDGTIIYGADSIHMDGQAVGAETRFTAPTAGTFNVSGQFSYGDTNMTSHTVSIVDNLGNTLFSTMLTNGSTQSFSLSNVTLVSGGWLDFVTGTDGGASYAGTNLQATVAAVPEPANWSLMGLGLLGVILARKRRKSALGS